MVLDHGFASYTPHPDDPYPFPRPRPFPFPFPFPWPPWPGPRPWPYQIAEFAVGPLLIAAVQAELGARMKDKVGSALNGSARSFIDDWCGTMWRKFPPQPGPGPWPWIAASVIEAAAVLPEGVVRDELQRGAGLLLGGR